MNNREKIIALANQASKEQNKKQYEIALDTYAQALKIAQAENLIRFCAVILNYIGDILQAQGKIQEAVIIYESAIRTLESKDTSRSQSIIDALSRSPKDFYNNIEPAPDLYTPEAAATLEQEASDRTLPIKLWLDIGNAYLSKLQEDPALNAYNEALKYPEIEKNLLLKAYAIANIGEIYRRQDNLALAQSNIEQALQLFDRVNKPLAKRGSLAILASIYRDLTLIPEAEQLYQESLSLYIEAGDTKGEVKTLVGLASLHLEQQNFSQAQSLYQQASKIAEEIKDRETLGYCYFGLGCCCQAREELEQAIANFEEALKSIEFRQDNLRTDEAKVTFLDSIKDVFDRLLIAHLDLAQRDNRDYTQALEVAERARGRALGDLMGISRRRHPQRKQQESLLENELRNTPRQAAPGIHETPVRQEQETRKRAIKAEPLTRLVFYVLLDRTAIFVVTPNQEVSAYVSTIGCHAWEKKVAHLRKTMQVDEASRGLDRKLIPVDSSAIVVPNSGNLETLLKEFYADLVAPVANSLPEIDRTLVIEPHASLWLVPFAALQLPDDQYMSDRYSLIYTPSLETLEEVRQEKPYATISQSPVHLRKTKVPAGDRWSKFLIVGNPEMPTVPISENRKITLKPLSGAQEEAEAIAKLLTQHECQLLTGKNATELKVKNFTATHNIVHLATHGIAYTTKPLRSFVAFTPTDNSDKNDGLLTAQEIAEKRDLPADLVVLSACQTALGRVSGDGMIGLSRAFLIAGARTVIVSQWSVSDRATKELMIAFYEYYLELGNKAIALQKAMQTVRSMTEYKAPQYWAAFSLVGAEL